MPKEDDVSWGGLVLRIELGSCVLVVDVIQFICELQTGSNLHGCPSHDKLLEFVAATHCVGPSG
jgi:hypothetical protein